MQLKLLQRVFILFIGVIIPLNIYAFIDNANERDYSQPVTNWSGEDFSHLLNQKLIEKDTILETVSDSLATDSVKKKEKLFCFAPE